MTDFLSLMDGTHREIGRRSGDHGDVRVLRIRRTYDAPIEDVWSACTEPERLRRFFTPVSGELRVGGRFQLEGNAGGEILRCDPPHLLRVTWEFGGGPASQVEVRLSAGRGDGTVLELEHAPVPERIAMAGREIDPVLNDVETGIWGMGAGWEMGLVGLAAFLRGEMPPEGDAASLADSPEIAALADRCGKAWAAVVAAEG